ncbi:C40 family peptidase [Tersicoccus sp. MR15.9]|uniref:C40 family peptidase n=1 Tax=Tersicoccus mangrovi TaxID=3121635 RepID=UPI002FE629A2
MTGRDHLTNASKAAAENRGVVRGGAVAAAAAGLLAVSVAPANASAYYENTTATTPQATTAASSAGHYTWTSNGITYTWNGANIQDGYRYFGLTGSQTAPAPTGATPTASYSAAGAAAPAAGAQTANVSLASAAKTSTGGNQSIVSAAYAGIGHPYVWGGTSTSGWDCSGFVQWAYAQAGKSIPRTYQWTAMTPTSAPKPGDLIVQNGGSHVGIYVGNGMEISALNPQQGTLLHPVSAMSVDGYYTLG